MLTWLTDLRRLSIRVAAMLLLCGFNPAAGDVPTDLPEPPLSFRFSPTEPTTQRQRLHVTEPTGSDPRDRWMSERPLRDGRAGRWRPGGRFGPTDSQAEGRDIFLLHPPNTPSLDPWLEVLTQPGEPAARPERDELDPAQRLTDARQWEPTSSAGRSFNPSGGRPGISPTMLIHSVPEPTTVFFIAAALAWATHRFPQRGRKRRTARLSRG